FTYRYNTCNKYIADHSRFSSEPNVVKEAAKIASMDAPYDFYALENAPNIKSPDEKNLIKLISNELRKMTSSDISEVPDNYKKLNDYIQAYINENKSSMEPVKSTDIIQPSL